MSSGRLPLDNSYRKLIDQRHLRDTERTKNSAECSLGKNLTHNWIRGKGFGVAGGGVGVELNKSKNKDNISA